MKDGHYIKQSNQKVNRVLSGHISWSQGGFFISRPDREFQKYGNYKKEFLKFKKYMSAKEANPLQVIHQAKTPALMRSKGVFACG